MIVASLAVVAASALVQGAAAVSCAEYVCYYDVKADMAWTPERHPVDFPMDPVGFFSPFWTVAHDDSFVLWRDGELANPGIQEIAEFGSGEAFLEEVEECGEACGPGEGFPCEPMGGECSVSGEVLMSADKPYLSIGTMHAPSPDWFTGIDSWPLCVDGEWVEMVAQDVFPYDSGTDAGPTFLSPDVPLSKPHEIFSFNAVTPAAAQIFYNFDEGVTYNVGTIYVQRSMCMRVEEVGMYGEK